MNWAGVRPMEEVTSELSERKKGINKGAWTAEEDRKLAGVIEMHGPKRWKTLAAKAGCVYDQNVDRVLTISAGLDRCGKSCRLRWMNYLRPDIKRGNISDQEEDLILRLHKLLGNRWSLIAGRLPGRTDNEIKNYWNSHLSKKIKRRAKQFGGETTRGGSLKVQSRKGGGEAKAEVKEEETSKASDEESNINFDFDDFFDFSDENPKYLEWLSRFIDVNDAVCQF
ncbi:hypothetical protein Nepgr_019415 [Nepenthes gracilis]|uniref:Uncharacterized protein n=1 Tax=Nepenthes gracilis TaxID=150966 RepID=A0AAD3SV95_NEPGR|nr:hypothetical protein Nepgr_019415 [Nepenthes gracilis]